ncbi:MAG TPA: peptidoglycan-associated lipoprotein Pal [Burkholderiales bacterium]|nr:peptidoglycan-associated lipoprotein Pal [Burkholderiales bacterium]
MMKRITVLALVALIAACSSTPDKEQKAAAVEERSPGAKPADKPAATGAEATPLKPGAVGGNPLTDPASPLSKRSVFFDFDSFVIKDEFKSLIQAHAQYLKQNAKAKVILQGNADERGSREYNLALGQKRSDAVKKALEVLGVPEAQIESVSFGEEKPRGTGHDEASWAENRRADIVYQGE